MSEKMMELTAADGFTFTALHVEAEGARKGGLVLIQEIFGLNTYMADAARKFARAGFEVIAPSMFDRQEKGFVREGHDAEAIGAGGGHARANGLDNAMNDIAACIDALEGPVYRLWLLLWRLDGLPRRLQVLDGLTAASCYYGSLVPASKGLEPRCPAIVHFGRRDGFIPMDGVDAFAKARVPTCRPTSMKRATASPAPARTTMTPPPTSSPGSARWTSSKQAFIR
jgi:carboxymethylenebutenolidase